MVVRSKRKIRMRDVRSGLICPIESGSLNRIYSGPHLLPWPSAYRKRIVTRNLQHDIKVQLQARTSQERMARDQAQTLEEIWKAFAGMADYS